MSIQTTQENLQSRLPDFTVTFEEKYKGKPNTRFIFKKDGYEDVAILLANSLNPPEELLNNIAEAVQKKVASVGIKEQRKAELLKELSPEEESSSEPEEATDVPTPDIEREFYKIAKKLVKAYEKKHPMT